MSTDPNDAPLPMLTDASGLADPERDSHELAATAMESVGQEAHRARALDSIES